MDEDFKLKYLKLATNVKVMRMLQKEYFRKRDPMVLIESKRMEKIVDEILNPLPSSQATFDWLAQ